MERARECVNTVSAGIENKFSVFSQLTFRSRKGWSVMLIYSSGFDLRGWASGLMVFSKIVSEWNFIKLLLLH